MCPIGCPAVLHHTQGPCNVDNPDYYTNTKGTPTHQTTPLPSSQVVLIASCGDGDDTFWRALMLLVAMIPSGELRHPLRAQLRAVGGDSNLK